MVMSRVLSVIGPLNLPCCIPLLLFLLLLMILGVPYTGGQETGREIHYRVTENTPPATMIGNIYIDADLSTQYPPSRLQDIHFRLLSKPEIDIDIEEDSGILRTATPLDRDTLCLGKASCNFKLDVVVLIPEPMNILEIIKANVEVVDINDNAPEFTETSIARQISEATLPGSSFVLPTATDPDSGKYAIQEYTLQGGEDKFKLDVKKKVDGSTEVRLVLSNRLDREVTDQYDLKVLAIDGGVPPKSGSIDVAVTVLDANDNDPLFANSTYEVTIPENTAKGTTIIQVQAVDPDLNLFGAVSYGFSDNTRTNYGHLFSINNLTGEVNLKETIDYESSSIYHLTVTAQDQGPDSIPADATLIVRVVDLNDNAPRITVNTVAATGTDAAQIAENADLFSFVAYLTVTDPDDGDNGRFECNLNDNSFKLEQLYDDEYKIVTSGPLDREKHDQYNLAVMCEDFGREPQVAIKHIHVTVTDVNDNAPVFRQNTYSANLIERNPPGAYVVHVNATDPDGGKNGRVMYSLEETAQNMFTIDSSGIVTTKVVFDHEQVKQLQFKVIASDAADPPLSSSALVVVNINDLNDEKPIFSQPNYSFGVLENEPPGTSVGMVRASDADSEPYNAFEFSLLPTYSATEMFAVDALTGKITTKVELDREEQSVYYLVVMASDHNIPPMSSTASVSVYVGDKNDNSPRFEYPSTYNNTIYVSSKIPLDYVITRVQASDRDISQNGNLTYHIISGNEEGIFIMDVVKGTLVANENIHHIDYDIFELHVVAQDQGDPQQTASTILNIVVNKSINYRLDPPQGLGYNFTIVVSMVTVSALVVIILVVAIIVIRKQDHEDRVKKYMEAKTVDESEQKFQMQTEVPPNKRRASAMSFCSGGSFNSLDSRKGASPRNHVPKPPGPNNNCHSLKQDPQVPSISKKVTTKTKSPNEGGETVPAHAAALNADVQRQGSQNNQSTSSRQTAPWVLTDHPLQARHLMGDNEEVDEVSTSSAEGSHADSGRGPSESGEGLHHQQAASGIPPGGSMPVTGRPPVPHPPPPPRQHPHQGPWMPKSRANLPVYAKPPTAGNKLQTFIGSNSNTSADSGFRDNSDREVSDVDSETNNPDNKAPQMVFYQRPRNNNVESKIGKHNLHKHIPPPPRAIAHHKTAPMCHNGYHRNNCGCPSQRTTPHYGNAEGNQYFYGAPKESIVMTDLGPRHHHPSKDKNSFMINLREGHSSDNPALSSDVVV